MGRGKKRGKEEGKKGETGERKMAQRQKLKTTADGNVRRRKETKIEKQKTSADSRRRNEKGEQGGGETRKINVEKYKIVGRDETRGTKERGMGKGQGNGERKKE